MAGGPTVNLLIAFFLFWGVFGFHGIRRRPCVNSGPPVIESVSECLLPYAEDGRACAAADPETPAYAIGLRPGDTITSFNGTADHRLGAAAHADPRQRRGHRRDHLRARRPVDHQDDQHDRPGRAPTPTRRRRP